MVSTKRVNAPLVAKKARRALWPAMSDPARDPPLARALWRERDYPRFWASRFMGSLGSQIQSVTMGWQIYDISRRTLGVEQSAFNVSLIGLITFGPLIVLALPAGESADRYDRRRVLLMCYAGETTAVAALAWIALNHMAISPGAAYLATAMLYLGAAAALISIGGNTKPQVQPGSRLALVREGLAYVWANKVVLGAISLDLAAVILGGATALLPAFAKDVLHVGAQGFGILRAGPALGASAVGLYLASHPIRSKAGRKMLLAVAIYGAATVVFGLSKSLWLSVAALAVLGGADMLSVFVRQTLVQLVTPDPMRGRVGAVSGVFIGASNELGEFESGVAARFLGPVGAAVFGGVGALIVTATWAKLFPALREADRLE